LPPNKIHKVANFYPSYDTLLVSKRIHGIEEKFSPTVVSSTKPKRNNIHDSAVDDDYKAATI
jgi:hypothetical protein